MHVDGYFHVCCAQQQSQGIVGTEQQDALRSSLIGEWVCVMGHRKLVLMLTEEGSFELGNQKGRYGLEANIVRLKTNNSEWLVQQLL